MMSTRRCSISVTSASPSRLRSPRRRCLGRLNERWIIVTRRWTLLAWTALGIGILLGPNGRTRRWGWGGYYAWDPVENAALMPWLASTAFLHSVMVQEKKNMLRIWNVGARLARVLPLALRHVPHPKRCDQLDPQLHAVVDRRLVPRLHLVVATFSVGLIF